MSNLKRLPRAVAKATDGVPSALVLLVGGCCILLAVGLASILVPDAGEPSGPGAAPEEETAAPVSSVSTRLVASRPGRFRVEVPKVFGVERQGERLVLTTRDQQMVATVSPTTSGPVEPVLDSLVEAVHAKYQDVQPGGRQVRRADARAVHVAVGQATNSSNVPLFYLAAAVRAEDRNLAVTAFIAHDRAPADVLPQLNAVVNSVRPDGRDTARP